MSPKARTLAIRFNKIELHKTRAYDRFFFSTDEMFGGEFPFDRPACFEFTLPPGAGEQYAQQNFPEMKITIREM
jgi:hypothetical protein